MAVTAHSWMPRRLVALALLAAAGAARAGHEAELADLGLEQLLGLEVYAASRFPQPQAEAPSAITVVTAEDIRQYGYRTLADVLRGIPGLHLSNDRVYDYLGVRGLRRAGDFNAPVLLLIDGRRMNDNVFEAAPIGNDLPVSIDRIERVEFVRGPGSSVFGSNALLGTINVITRAPAAKPGLRATGELGTAGRRRAGLQLDAPAGELRLQLNAELGRRGGEDIRIDAADGRRDYRGLDHETVDHYGAKLATGPWTLQAVHGERRKQSPLPIYGADEGASGNHYEDRLGFVSLGYEAGLGTNWQVQGQLLYGHYDFDGELQYNGVANRDLARGRWWNGEWSGVYGGFEHHHLLVGVDFQEDVRQQQTNFDPEPYQLYQDSRQRGSRMGVFVQDDWRLGTHFSLNAGLRHDLYSDFDAVTTPRLALIARASPRQTVKLIYGEAYRVPSAYERYYAAEGYEPNPDLQPERAHNADLIWELRASETLRLQAAAQWLWLRDYILQSADDPKFTNRGRVEVRGLDLMVDKDWFAGARGRAALTLQDADGRDGRLEDSPRWLAKLQGSLPLPGNARLAAELLGRGPRRTARGRVDGDWLTNLTVSGLRLRPGLELAASVDNPFDARRLYPSSPDLVAEGIDAVPAEGRQLRLRLYAEF